MATLLTDWPAVKVVYISGIAWYRFVLLTMERQYRLDVNIDFEHERKNLLMFEKVLEQCV